MRDNRIERDSFIEEIKKEYGEQCFHEAVSTLENYGILFEGQFPFLMDATMRDRNMHAQRAIFNKFGFENSENIQSMAFEVQGEGWMHCFVIAEGQFESIENIKKAVHDYYSI